MPSITLVNTFGHVWACAHAIACLSWKNLFNMLGLSFSSKLDCDSYVTFNAKTYSKKIGTFICSMKFLSREVALFNFKSTIRPCIVKSKLSFWDSWTLSIKRGHKVFKFCTVFIMWAGVPGCYLEMLDKLP